RPLNREQSIDGRCIGVADATCLNPDANMSKRRIEYRLRGQLPLAGTDNLDRTVGAFSLQRFWSRCVLHRFSHSSLLRLRNLLLIWTPQGRTRKCRFVGAPTRPKQNAARPEEPWLLFSSSHVKQEISRISKRLPGIYPESGMQLFGTRPIPLSRGRCKTSELILARPAVLNRPVVAGFSPRSLECRRNVTTRLARTRAEARDYRSTKSLEGFQIHCLAHAFCNSLESGGAARSVSPIGRNIYNCSKTNGTD